MAGTFPDAWEEAAKVVIIKLGGTAYLYEALTETIDIGEPDYPGESIPNLAGGRVWKQSPQEDGEITMEIYPTQLDTTASVGLFQEFNGGTWDVAQPIATDTTWTAGVSRTRDRFMVAIMWTDDTTITTAALVLNPTPSTATDKVALRFYAKECRITSHKSAYTDGILKTTVTFKFPAMNYAGDTKTHGWESSNDLGTTAISTLTYAEGL